MPKVTVLDNIAAEGLSRLEATEGIEVAVRTGLKGTELKQALADTDAAICRSGVTIDEASLQDNRRLKAIVRAGVGTDNIDKAAATRLGVVVMNTPDGNTISTAEHAFALMLGLARNIAPAYGSLQSGRWDRKTYMGTQLHGKTLGIVGLGRIGRAMASRGIAFGMRVCGYDKFLSDEKALELGIEPMATVRDMLPKVDFLTVHTPLNDETRNLLSEGEIEIMKPGARVINCARGGIYDETALLAGLKSGRLGGVALDVYEHEPCTDSPLFAAPSTLCTPHLGASTEEAQTQVAMEAVELAINFLQSGEVKHAVNTAALDRKTLTAMRGELNMVHRLGLLLAQRHTGHPSKCSVVFRGEAAHKDTQLMTAAFCAGLMQKAMDEEVNIVNAEMLMKERGIETVVETHSDQGAFSSSVRASLQSEDCATSASGTLFGNQMPRLIMIDDFRLEAYLDGVLLIFTHQDVPGIIGRVGTIFGEHGVNIAQMTVGRAGEPGGAAVAVLNLDSRPSAEALRELLGAPNIHHATVAELPGADELPSWLQV